jgi:hypothetical protein
VDMRRARDHSISVEATGVQFWSSWAIFLAN